MNVVGAGGKSNIATMISSKYKEGYKSMLIIADGGGLGSDIGSIVAKMRKVRNRGCDTFVLLPECFEEVLLCSDYIGYTEEELLNEFKVEYVDTENYCELKLLEVTKGTVIECNHKSGYMSECWIKQCSNCNQDCSKRTNVEKFKYVLSN